MINKGDEEKQKNNHNNHNNLFERFLCDKFVIL